MSKVGELIMGMPKSVTRIRKNGVEFVSSVDRVKYSIEELSRAALKDTAKYLRKRVIEKLKTLPGMKRNKRLYSSTQYWVRKIEADLQIGFKHDTWYGIDQELGTSNMKKKGFLRDTVYENISEIRKIQAQYLSAIDKAVNLIDESEEVGDDNG